MQSHKRRHDGSENLEDQRDPYQVDRDRILHCSAFKRLGGVTQVAKAQEEEVFHTRLTHSLKVAQIGRRLAENVIRQSAVKSKKRAQKSVDSEVVEAACLAHDLGHPPFGHIGETELDRLVVENGDPCGFEGNAQTFRILTKLSVRFDYCAGLNLTGRTLASVIKYPWARDKNDEKKNRKWGYYKTEKADFEFARRHWHELQKRSIEAELMEWADDISYSIHDIEDFHRCNMIPWNWIFSEEGKNTLIDKAMESNKGSNRDAFEEAFERVETGISGLSMPHILKKPYDGSINQRQQIRDFSSFYVGRFLNSISLNFSNRKYVSINYDENLHREMQLLKQVTRDYIIRSPSLAAQQKGYQRIVREIFEDLLEEFTGKKTELRYFPIRFRHIYENKEDSSNARIVADCISGLTEIEVVKLHDRLRGIASGSIVDPIVR